MHHCEMIAIPIAAFFVLYKTDVRQVIPGAGKIRLLYISFPHFDNAGLEPGNRALDQKKVIFMLDINNR